MRGLRAALLLVSVGLLAACWRPLTKEELSDAALQARVQESLAGHSELELRYVTITADGGVVTLSGMVPSFEQRRRLYNLVTQVRGVEQVLNNLAIQE